MVIAARDLPFGGPGLGVDGTGKQSGHAGWHRRHGAVDHHHIRQLIPVALPPPQDTQPFFPTLPFKVLLAERDKDLAAQDLMQLGGKTAHFLTQPQEAEQLPIDHPGLHHPQGQKAKGAHFHAIGWLPRLAGAPQGGERRQIAMERRIMDPEENPLVRHEKIKMSRPAPGLEGLEQRGGHPQQGGAILAYKGVPEGGVAGEQGEFVQQVVAFDRLHHLRKITDLGQVAGHARLPAVAFDVKHAEQPGRQYGQQRHRKRYDDLPCYSFDRSFLHVL